jgi:CubicO group peptidase (beta-lactamase class C family)
MEISTLFDLASVTKLFTTTAILRLATQGALRLSDRVFALLAPSLASRGLGRELAARLAACLGVIDVAALLSHASGIHWWYPFYTRRGEAFESILVDVLEAHPPTGQVVYSDLNFMLLGRVVEAVTKTPLPSAVASLVFGPLGLGRSSYARPLGPCAAGEWGNRIERRMVAEAGLGFEGWRDESVPIRGDCDDGNCYYYFGGAAGHAGVFSDARDLCRLGRLFLDAGRLGTGRGAAWLAPALVREALADQGGLRGLGFQLGPNYPGEGRGHTGFTGSYLHINPARGLVIAILANRLHVAQPRDLNPYRIELSEAVLSSLPPH